MVLLRLNLFAQLFPMIIMSLALNDGNLACGDLRSPDRCAMLFDLLSTLVPRTAFVWSQNVILTMLMVDYRMVFIGRLHDLDDNARKPPFP